MHHWSDVCRYVRGFECSCDPEKLLWLPEFTGGPDRQVRSMPFGQLPETTTGGRLPAKNGRLTGRSTGRSRGRFAFQIGCSYLMDMRVKKMRTAPYTLEERPVVDEQNCGACFLRYRTRNALRCV